MYALIDTSNQMLGDSTFDMEGEIRAILRPARRQATSRKLWEKAVTR
ncbi:hypothetical protein [Microvirga sp. VF16]|nr:hypothetical protein [Microvirga sp. VF16]QRM29707.1 hypothetical protein JO965_01365 [Microvirga sp. VF16]